MSSESQDYFRDRILAEIEKRGLLFSRPLPTNDLVQIEAHGKGFEDTGEYDPAHEDMVRSLAELAAFYDEAGPRYDPEGNYLCGTCCLRDGNSSCLWVSGKISLTIGSCNIYIHGDELGKDFDLGKEKFSQEVVGYAERPEAKGFGCKRCVHGAEAKEPDVDGRKSWCNEWGTHIRKNACCQKHNGPDMVNAPGE